ncbi:hypothetical protein HK097_003018 [Rhizophlyctis rosea]|uniref:Uncharacterized protein n=1 Tax=Rhizophlyctis rosea TaxID=64517 RepID=A0AAD5SG44_9FUNG|nr:hypothetical protein HK097_003018 [Rhizophlyctis rosea]
MIALAAGIARPRNGTKRFVGIIKVIANLKQLVIPKYAMIKSNLPICTASFNKAITIIEVATGRTSRCRPPTVDDADRYSGKAVMYMTFTSAMVQYRTITKNVRGPNTLNLPSASGRQSAFLNPIGSSVSAGGSDIDDENELSADQSANSSSPSSSDIAVYPGPLTFPTAFSGSFSM